MVWSLYFWLGALMTSVTGSPGPPESMTPEEPERSRPPQIILEAAMVLVEGRGEQRFPFLQHEAHLGGGATRCLGADLRRQGALPSVCYSSNGNNSSNNTNISNNNSSSSSSTNRDGYTFLLCSLAGKSVCVKMNNSPLR